MQNKNPTPIKAWLTGLHDDHIFISEISWYLSKIDEINRKTKDFEIRIQVFWPTDSFNLAIASSYSCSHFLLHYPTKDMHRRLDL